MEVSLLSLSKRKYFLSQEGREKRTYEYLRNVLSTIDYLSADKDFISSMFLIRQGNINAIKLLVAKDKARQNEVQRRNTLVRVVAMFNFTWRTI